MSTAIRPHRGFTLVEILIVVIILGILAAIVIPQFAGASTDARTTNLKTTLANVRNQIEVFKCQHNELAPALTGMWTLMTSPSDTSEANSDAPTGTPIFFSSGTLSRRNASTPIFANPMALSIPARVSTTRIDSLPFRGVLEIAFVTNAPSLVMSVKSPYSLAYPQVPDAVIMGFRKRSLPMATARDGSETPEEAALEAVVLMRPSLPRNRACYKHRTADTGLLTTGH